MSQRSRAEKRLEERKTEQQRQRNVWIAGAIVAFALILAGLFVVANQPADAPIEESTLTRYANLPKGTNENGFPRLGLASAKVQVVEFSSFTCPVCGEFHRTVFPALLERIERGEINFTFVPVARGIANDEGATRTALCAANQDKFWELHDVYFDWLSRFGETAFTSNRLRAGAEGVGANVNAISECFRSGRINDLVLRGQQSTTATPTLRINGTPVENPLSLDEINEAIDRFGPFTAPAEANIPEATAEATPEATAEATPEATTEATPEATAEATNAP
jgi:protein-disulfide isomerase